MIIDEINEKYKALGQNPEVFLEGLKHNKLITYWDYIQTDTLLTLQKTRTDFPDEAIFVMYHQVTELYFKMILHEIHQIIHHPALTGAFFTARLERINRYFGILTSSFAVMRDGMELEQYLQFRNSLTPASGFQSAQYRLIEISCTDLKNLVDNRVKATMAAGEHSIEEMFESIYWQAAGKDHKTGKKTLTLQLFEEKYLAMFIHTAKSYKENNLARRYFSLPESEKTDALRDALRGLDRAVNIDWPMVHINTASRYLDNGTESKEATGGSEWKKYLHPKYQRRIFYPELWSADELTHWGE